MFAPLGFVPFEELVPLSTDIADDYIGDLDGLDTLTTEESRMIAAGHTVMSVWVLARLLGKAETAICSPDGRIFRAAPLLLFHEDGIGNIGFEWPPRENTKLHKMCQHAADIAPEIPYLDRFRFINTMTWTVDASPERLSHVRNYGLVIDEDVEPQCRIAANFDGWAVCLKDALAPKSVTDFYELVGYVEPADEEASSVRATGGRPALKGIARDTYTRLFPSGRGGMPWKEVERRVEEDLGRRISAKTIKRAIGQNPDRMD